MDEYIVEIDALHDDGVVLVAPALCLLVFGRTLDEALNQARDSIRFRLRETGSRDLVITFARDSRDADRSGRAAA
ncbi:MAG: hypothetical protein JO352_35955 [Chloroflexi bacterium]|nr:hypothetical protein [Chloroflexota bacterium]